MLVKEIMTTDVITVNLDTFVVDTAKKMEENDIGSILVSSNNTVNGIITDRDIVLRGVAKNQDVRTLTSNDVMSTNVVTATSDDDVDIVLDLMSDYQIKRVPIIDNNELVGIVSLADMSQTYMLEEEAGEVLNDITK